MLRLNLLCILLVFFIFFIKNLLFYYKYREREASSFVKLWSAWFKHEILTLLLQHGQKKKKTLMFISSIKEVKEKKEAKKCFLKAHKWTLKQHKFIMKPEYF